MKKIVPLLLSVISKGYFMLGPLAAVPDRWGEAKKNMGVVLLCYGLVDLCAAGVSAIKGTIDKEPAESMPGIPLAILASVKLVAGMKWIRQPLAREWNARDDLIAAGSALLTFAASFATTWTVLPVQTSAEQGRAFLAFPQIGTVMMAVVLPIFLRIGERYCPSCDSCD